MTTRYGLRRPLREGGIPEDPEPGVFGSTEMMGGFDAQYALINENCCNIWIIVIQEGIIANYCQK